MKADLHVHSTYSDGSDSIEMVMREAQLNGVTHLSFVDHDTTAGLLEAQRLGEHYGIEVIPGIEISAYDFKRDLKVHILGYNYQPEARHIKQLCDSLLKRRHAHTLWQIEQIKKVGFRLDLETISKAAKPSETIYKQHVMQQLTSAFYSSDAYQSLYKRLFKGDGPAAGDIEYVDAFDAVRAVVADGGIAVVAHPGQLDSYELIPELIEVGLGGIERNHIDHDEQDVLKVESLANQYQLIMTGGTDYHGSFGKSVQIGNITSPINLLFS
ncbi:PHP domain-containing protein [Oceanobacillus profundus]|uniref:PHP domain-containing protein n=1 Tax=Oceanobacillus profundus TaxID=372463 RepID=UPI002040A951|nr:PHP domain-containing protein [Oceanobacillus profundus]MCM3398590.1 PHP domain-containing protein [Oceanobacillus profundus]